MDIIYRKPLTQTSYTVLRQAGYIPIYDRISGKQSYVLQQDERHYPRLHLYVEEESDDHVKWHIHLDRRKHGWSHSRHDSDYDGEEVEAEAKRLIRWLKHFTQV